MAISSSDFWSFASELVTRNPNLGIPALEDGLFANLLVSIIYIVYLFCWEGKGEGKGKGKGKREGKREGTCNPFSARHVPKTLTLAGR